MQTLTMNIKEQYFDPIALGEKKSEFRRMSSFNQHRIEPMAVPFKLRLLNGMRPPVPELTVIVTGVTRHQPEQEYELHLGQILELKNWDNEQFVVSSALADIVGAKKLGRREIPRRFWNYVEEHGLSNGSKIRVDDKIRALVGGTKPNVALREVLVAVNENLTAAP